MIPHLHEIAGDRYEAQCGQCLRPSVPVQATSKENAWEQLLRIHWQWYSSGIVAGGYALCPKCSENPPDIEKAVARARKSRKRR